MPNQRLGTGCKILVEDPSGSGTYVNVGNLIDYNGPQFENAEVEVTNGDSTGKEFLPALLDPGSLAVNIHFDPDSAKHKQLFSDMKASPPTTRKYRVQLSSDTGSKFQGSAFVRSFVPSGGSRDQEVIAAVTFRLSGEWILQTVGGDV